MSNKIKIASVDTLSVVEKLGSDISAVGNVIRQTEARRANPSSAAFFQTAAPVDQQKFEQAKNQIDNVEGAISKAISVLSAPTHVLINTKN